MLPFAVGSIFVIARLDFGMKLAYLAQLNVEHGAPIHLSFADLSHSSVLEACAMRFNQAASLYPALAICTWMAGTQAS